MKRIYLPLLLGALVLAPTLAQAQSRVYRCGNEYTIIQGTRPMAAPVAAGEAPARVAAPAPRPRPVAAPAPSRISTPEQSSRESDARTILQAELRRAEARQAELMKDYNNGNPNWQAGEPQMPTRYQARVAEMKAAIDRNQADIEGIRRELSRYGN